MIEQLTDVVVKLAALSGACSALSAALPKPVNDGLLMLFHRLINRIGFNFANAENK